MIGYYPELHTEYARRKDIECYDIEAKWRAARAVALSRVPKGRCHANPDERIDHPPQPPEKERDPKGLRQK